jgi:EH domain-containing protein 1
MYRQNYINSLRTELVKMVSDYLSPAALHYGYSDVPLETNIKWRPLVFGELFFRQINPNQ